MFEYVHKKEFALNSSLATVIKIYRADKFPGEIGEVLDKWSYFLTNSQFHIMVPHNCVLDKNRLTLYFEDINLR